MTGPVIRGRAGRTPLPQPASAACPYTPYNRVVWSSGPLVCVPLPTSQLVFVPYTRYSILDTLVSPSAHVPPLAKLRFAS